MNLTNLINKYDKIIENLYIGNHKSPIDNQFIKDKNIKLIINCTKTYSYEINNDILLIRLNITDLNSPENNIIIVSNINKILDIIHIFLQSNEGVLVHCHMGQQRSAMVVACYLMKFYKYELKKSIKKIKEKRKYAFLPQATFMDFMKYFELDLKN